MAKICLVNISKLSSIFCGGRLEDLGEDGIMLKQIFKKGFWNMWTGFIWF